jgi:hypothetical protein
MFLVPNSKRTKVLLLFKGSFSHENTYLPPSKIPISVFLVELLPISDMKRPMAICIKGFRLIFS